MSLKIELQDTKLVQEAVEAGQHDSDVEAILAALKAYVAKHKRQQIVTLFNQVEYDPDFDYKEQRRKA